MDSFFPVMAYLWWMAACPLAPDLGRSAMLAFCLFAFRTQPLRYRIRHPHYFFRNTVGFVLVKIVRRAHHQLGANPLVGTYRRYPPRTPHILGIGADSPNSQPCGSARHLVGNSDGLRDSLLPRLRPIDWLCHPAQASFSHGPL
jgi:hypothetical protein